MSLDLSCGDRYLMLLDDKPAVKQSMHTIQFSELLFHDPMLLSQKMFSIIIRHVKRLAHVKIPPTPVRLRHSHVRWTSQHNSIAYLFLHYFQPFRVDDQVLNPV